LRKVFLDTAFFIGLLNVHDQHHQSAEQVDAALLENDCDLYTSQMVLTEVLNGLSDKGKHVRLAAGDYVQELARAVSVVKQTPELFNAAFDVFRQYKDKEWGLVDCSSFVIMEECDIHEAATTDEHFKQMGRRILMRSPRL
jgi:predicted nucleic acid-binding protein